MSFLISIESISMLSHVPIIIMPATAALQIHAVVNNSVVC